MSAERPQEELPTVSTHETTGVTQEYDSRLLAVGDEFDGLKILNEVGRGGMGVVYRALEKSLKRIVAVKFLSPDIANNESVAKRFKREAVLAANLRHPNIVPVYKVDDSETPKYFTMEYVEGRSLKQLLGRDKRVDLDTGLRIAVEASEALEHAHQQNIVHRDIKPANIMLDGESGRVRVTDFGIAQDTTGQLAEMTRTEGTSAGTPAFMSPEQNMGEKIDGRTDIFSLGTTLYRMFTGKMPYRARTMTELAVAFQKQKPEPPNRLNPDMPPALSRVIIKMMDIDRGSRYAEFGAVLEDLKNIGRSGGAGRMFSRKQSLVGAGIAAAVLIAGACLFLFGNNPPGHNGTTGVNNGPGLACVINADGLLQGGDLDGAAAQYRRAWKMEEAAPASRADAAAGIARVASAQGKTGEALEWYRKALDIEPGNNRALLGMAVIIDRQGDHAKAFAILEPYRNGEDPRIAILARQAKRSMAAGDRQQRNKRVDALVDDIVALYKKQADAPADGDAWTSRRLAVCFTDVASVGRPSLYEGADEVLVAHLSERLIADDRFDVVSREMLDEVLAELKLSVSGLADPDAALKYGKIRTAGAMVAAKIRRTAKKQSISMKIIDTETTRILGYVSCDCEDVTNAAALDRLAGDVMEKLRECFPIKGMVSSVTGDTATLNIGRAVGVEAGMVFAVLHPEDPSAAVGTLKIEKAAETTATAVVEQKDIAIGKGMHVRFEKE